MENNVKPVSTLAICVIELLERLAFYSFLSVFVVFLTNERGMANQAAFDLYGWVMFLFYVAPILGGPLSDQVLGHARAVALGAGLLALGYVGLAVLPHVLLYPALAVLTLGSGLFKPALLALLSTGSGKSDLGRDAAFIWLFVAINIGAALGPVLGSVMAAGAVHQSAFIISMLGQLAAMTLALLALRPLGAASPSAAPTSAAPAATQAAGNWGLVLRILLLTGLAGCVRGAVHIQLVLWSRDHADLTFAGRLPASLGSTLVQSSESLFQVLLAPLLVLAFVRLRRRGIVPSSAAKIGMAMVLQMLPCLLLLRAALAGDDGQPVSAAWLLGANLLSALPNLFLVPLVFSVVARLVPATRQATLFAISFPIQALLNGVASKAGMALHQLPPTWMFAIVTLIAMLAAALWIAHTRRIDRALTPAPATP